MLPRGALKAGGLLILITPNTKDLGVITENFWLDITHQRPYPLKLLRKMLADAGLSEERSGEDADTVPRLKLSLKAGDADRKVKNLRGVGKSIPGAEVRF